MQGRDWAKLAEGAVFLHCSEVAGGVRGQRREGEEVVSGASELMR